MIEVISIDNFKCFRAKNVKFKPLTVLSGVNAVGKSSLIQSLLLAIQCDDSVKSVNRVNNVRISLNGVNGLYLGSISDISNYYTAEEDFSINYGNSEAMIDIKSNINKKKDTISFGAEISRQGSKVTALYSSLRESQYISAERLGPKTIYEEAEDFTKVGEEGQYSISILNNRINDSVPAERCLNPTSIKLLLKSVEEWLDYLVPGTELRTEYLNGVEKVKLEIRNSRSGKFIKPTNTGFGISYVLPIIVAGMIAPHGSLLIVENPEAHLHPLGQSRVGEFLAKVSESGVQVIVETHSDHFINGLRLAVTRGNLNKEHVLINFFSRTEDYEDIIVDDISINAIGELDKWPKGFLDQERNDFQELMKMRMGV